MGLCAANMFAGCHLVGHAEAVDAEEPQQATALLLAGLGGRRKRTLLLEFITGWDALSSFISGHNHSPNAYLASPFTTVV